MVLDRGSFRDFFHGSFRGSFRDSFRGSWYLIVTHFVIFFMVLFVGEATSSANEKNLHRYHPAALCQRPTGLRPSQRRQAP